MARVREVATQTTGAMREMLDGGELGIDWRADGVWMTGPTALVFEGRLSADFLGAVA